MKHTASFGQIVFALVALVALPCAAQSVGTPARFDAHCEFQGHRLDLHVESSAGDAYEDDMQISMHVDGKASPIDVEPAQFKPSSSMFNFQNHCDTVVGVSLGGNLLVILRRDNRPAFDHAVGLLLDHERWQLAQPLVDLGELKFNEVTLRRQSESVIELRVVGEVLPNTACDCAQARIERWRKIQAAPEGLRLEPLDSPE